MPSKHKGRSRAHEEEISRAVGEEHVADDEHVVVDAEVLGAAEEATAASEGQVGEIGWRERASFTVAFDSAPGALDEIIWRTRAYREETDVRAEWQGITGTALFEWMCGQANLPVEVDTTIVPRADESAPMSSEPAPTPSEPVLSLELSELLLAEVMIEQELGSWSRMLPGPVYARRLRSQLHFALAGPAAVEAALNRSHYTIQISACSLANGELQVLASEQGELQPYTTSYASRAEFSMPPLGSYRVQATVLLPDEGIVGVVLGPVLTVMP